MVVSGPGNVPPGPPVGPDGILAPGVQVGRFVVQGLLGQGGMGAVYRAWDPVLERTVALKALRVEDDDFEEAQERFRREALTLAQLNHQNVCKIHDLVDWQGQVFIAMEFIEGQLLSEAAAGLDTPGKLRALRSMAGALEAAHARGIVHRDLKPGNIMVDAEGQVKVLDFGLARLVEPGTATETHSHGVGEFFLPEEAGDGSRGTLGPHLGSSSDQATRLGSPAQPGSRSDRSGQLTQAGHFMGSPAYSSPEQLCGRGAGPASDIFSLGIVAWELLLGDHPFPGAGRDRMQATLNGELKPLMARKVTPRVGLLLRTMLAVDPAQRPSARDVAETLDRMLKPPTLAQWAAASIALAALLAGLGYLGFGRSIVADLARERPPRLAVLPLRNETGNPRHDAVVEVGMTELLTSALRPSPKLAIVESDQLTRAFTQFHLDPTRALDPEHEALVLRALGAALFIRGTLTKTDSGSLAFTYELVEPSGKVRLAGRTTTPDVPGLTPFLLVNPAAAELLKKVDPLHSSGHQELAVPPEVFSAYARGKALFLKGDFKGCEPLLQQASQASPAWARAVVTYAATLRRLGRESSLDVANWALMAARATADRWSEGRALGLKAFLARDRGDLVEAERLRRGTLELARAIRDRDGESVALNHLGILAADRGRDGEARAFYEQSLALARQMADPLNTSLAQNNLANLSLNVGDLRAAEEGYASSLEIQRSIGNRWGEALALNNLGVVALAARELPKAEARLKAALDIRTVVGDRGGQCTCLRNLGILTLMQGNPAEAETYHQRALSIAQNIMALTVEAECRFYLGDVHRLQGRFPKAMAEYRQVLDLLAKGATPEVRVNAQAALAECLARSDRRRAKVAGDLLEAIPEVTGDTPYVHRARAWLHTLAGNFDQALAELRLAVADPRHQAPELQGELKELETRIQGR